MDNKIPLIRKRLRQLSNKEIAGHSQRFFKTGEGEYGEGDKFLGVRVPVLRKLAKEFRGIALNEVILLLKSRFHEERLLSLFILIDLYKASDNQEKEKIYGLYLTHARSINNWDLVDSSAEHIAGAYLWKKNTSPLYALAESNNLWERRISIMSTFCFIKQNDFRDALKISEILLSDKEDLIHKAVGWMLREVGKRNILIEEAFLKRHSKIMPRTMLRYAIEKFPETKRKIYMNKSHHTVTAAETSC